MRAKEILIERTGKSEIYNITHIANIPSIMKEGILCYDKAEEIHHHSIAMNEVQLLREKKTVPNGLRLHQYANAYFDARNPMLYLRQDKYMDICVLVIDASIMDVEGCVISDGNATSNATLFSAPLEGLYELDFGRIYAQWWTDVDPRIKENNKRIKCAEILVPYCIPYEFVIAAVVMNDAVKERLRRTGFEKDIIIDSMLFFDRG